MGTCKCGALISRNSVSYISHNAILPHLSFVFGFGLWSNLHTVHSNSPSLALVISFPIYTNVCPPESMWVERTAGLFLVGLCHRAHWIQQESKCVGISEGKSPKKETIATETSDKTWKELFKYSQFTLYHWFNTEELLKQGCGHLR